jgi:Tfp pilus assembly protein PilF
MKRVAAVVLLLGCAAGASPASGSEESQALAARGMIELNAGRTSQALELFNRAVAADPTDAEALFQRAVARQKLGDDAGATADLRAALNLQPNFPAANLELGSILAETGHSEEAVPYLQRAQYAPALDAQASFYLGVAHLRADRLDDAQQDFERARARDPSLALTVQYYEGVIAYRRHDLDLATANFTAVEAANRDSPIGRESTQFLDLIRRTERAAYSAFGTLALEYDSNVTLGPSTTTANGISGQGDWRAVIALGGTYVPLRIGALSLALSYDFFQSLQFRLTDFDLQDNRPGAQLMYDFGPVFVALLGRYDYYLLETDSFMQEATALPWVVLREGDYGHTDLYYRMQWRQYKENFLPSSTPPMPGAVGFKQLDGFYNFAGVRQTFPLGAPDRELKIGYQLGFEQPDGEGTEAFQYGSQAIEIALRWPLVYGIIGEAGYRFEHQRYAPASGDLNIVNGVPVPRRDGDNRVIVSFERPLPEINEHLFVNVSYFGTFNNSNNPSFNYNRQIGSGGLEVRF